MTMKSLADMARKYTDYDMIEAHTTLPPYPENRARLLYHFFNPEIAEPDKQLYTLAVSLAQLGMETHDLVDEPESGETIMSARSRQLNVLAGDYFNGRFYDILSRAGRLDIVRKISKAIADVNRLKVILFERFQDLKLTAEDYVEQLVIIKSELYLTLSRMIPLRSPDRFEELFRSVVRCEIISDELDLCEEDQPGSHFAFWYVLQVASPEDREKMLTADADHQHLLASKYKIRAVLSHMLSSQIQLIRRLSEQLDSETIRAEINRLIELFARRLSMPVTAEKQAR